MKFLTLGFSLLIVLSAIASVAVAVVLSNTEKTQDGNSEPVSSETFTTEVFAPTDDEIASLKNSAENLYAKNIRIIEIFFTKGLPALPEPYGNEPEDGYLTVDIDILGSDNNIKSLYDLENLVKSITTSEKSSAFLEKYSVLFGAKKYSGNLGIYKDFKTTPAVYDYSKTEFNIKIETSETAVLLISLKTPSGDIDQKEIGMTKENGEWKFDNLILNER